MKIRNRIIAGLVLALVAALCGLYFTSCASMTPDERAFLMRTGTGIIARELEYSHHNNK